MTSAVMEEKDILIVSLEPTIHANIFRDKDRVVIQDFYMSTVRHPFFKWFLDDRSYKLHGIYCYLHLHLFPSYASSSFKSLSFD